MMPGAREGKAHVTNQHLRVMGQRSRVVVRRLATLMRQPVFLVLTVVVHGSVVLSGALLYALEHETNPRVGSFLDAVYWAMATVTTVGYGDVAPVTMAGKVLSMVVMVFGSLVTVLYTALFATALVAPELTHVESSMRKIEHEFRHLEDEQGTDNA